MINTVLESIILLKENHFKINLIKKKQKRELFYFLMRAINMLNFFAYRSYLATLFDKKNYMMTDYVQLEDKNEKFYSTFRTTPIYHIISKYLNTSYELNIIVKSKNSTNSLFSIYSLPTIHNLPS
jgi:hypothetical protein